MLSEVFYLNLDSIELQAERTVDPTLKTRPVAIISSTDSNGTIISLSHEAEEEGLYKGMKVSIAKKKKQTVQFLPYNHALYQRVSKYTYDTLSAFTPVIEPSGMNGFYMDMRGMPLPSGDIKGFGLSVLKKVESRISLLSVMGIGSNKLISRIITSVVPDIIHEVSPGAEDSFLAPLNFDVLPTARLKSVHKILYFLLIDRIGQLQKLSQYTEDFRTLFGIHSIQLANEAVGRDTSLVRPPILKDRLLEQTILPKNTNDESILLSAVQDLAEKIAFQLRKRRRVAKKIKLEIHYIDGFSSYRTGCIDYPDDISVSKECKKLFLGANNRRISIRSILLDAVQLRPYAEQKNLFYIPESRDMEISRAVETIRRKHGIGIIKKANVLHALG